MIAKFLSIAIFIGGVLSLGESEVSGSRTAVPGAYIVELATGYSVDNLNELFRSGGLPGTIRHSFSSPLFSGLSFQLHDPNSVEAINLIANFSGVKKIWPVDEYQKPAVKGATPKTKTRDEIDQLRKRQVGGNPNEIHKLTQVDKLKAKGVTGKGVKVAIVGCGVDFKHPSLGGCFGPGCLISYGYDFINNQSNPYSIDCREGDTAAGVIAARQNSIGFTGIAPDVTLGVYLATAHGIITDNLIAAFLKAYGDGSNIILFGDASMDLSSWNDDPLNLAIQRISDAGVACVIQTAINSRPGPFNVPLGGEAAITVAAVENTQLITLTREATYIQKGVSKKFEWIPYNAAWYEPLPGPWPNVTAPLLLMDFVANTCNFSTLSNGTDFSKYILTGINTFCTLEQLLDNMKIIRAKYWLQPWVASSSVEIFQKEGNPSVAQISPSAFKEWQQLLSAGVKVVVTMVDDLHAKKFNARPNPEGGLISSFSSWGPTWDLGVKPDISAPGRSLVSTGDASYYVETDTSSSGAHLAGVIALIYQVRGKIAPKFLRDLLSSTASIVPKFVNITDTRTIVDYPAPVVQQGGGLIKAFDAAYTTTVFNPARISFNDTDHFGASKKIEITNKGSAALTYQVAHRGAVTVYTLGSDGIVSYPSDNTTTSAKVALSPNKITIQPGKSATISVSLTPPELNPIRLPIYSGFLEITTTEKGVRSSWSIPYQGMLGSLYNATILKPPVLKEKRKRRHTTYWEAIEDSAKVYVEKIDYSPRTLYNYGLDIFWNLRSRISRAYLVPVSENGTMLPPLGELYGSPLLYGRHGGYDGSGYTVLEPFFGDLNNGVWAPGGLYVIETRVLRHFGNPANQKDWYVYHTQKFNMTYESPY